MLCIKLPVSIFERSNPTLRAHYFMVFGWLLGRKEKWPACCYGFIRCKQKKNHMKSYSWAWDIIYSISIHYIDIWWSWYLLNRLFVRIISLFSATSSNEDEPSQSGQLDPSFVTLRYSHVVSELEIATSSVIWCISFEYKWIFHQLLGVFAPSEFENWPYDPPFSC